MENSILLNEEAIKVLGWDDPIGKKIVMIDENAARLERTVVGIIKDVNLTTVRRKVNPMVIVHSGTFIPQILVKLKPGNEESAREELNRIFMESFPEARINVQFFDDVFKF